MGKSGGEGIIKLHSGNGGDSRFYSGICNSQSYSKQQAAFEKRMGRRHKSIWLKCVDLVRVWQRTS
jgi:hypothetical protein